MTLVRQSIMQAQAMASQPTSGEIGLVVRGAGNFATYAADVALALNMRGQYENRSGYTRHIMGRRTSFTASVYNDCAEWLSSSASIVLPNSAAALRFRSSASGDTLAGSGTREVAICYISADSGYVGQEIQYVTSTAGAGYINLPFHAQAINNFEATAGGSSEVSLGNITVEDSGSPTTIYSQITAGGNKALGAHYMVPTSYVAHLVHWDVGAVQQTMDARLRATVMTCGSAMVTDRFIFQGNAYLEAGGREREDLSGLRFPAGCRVKTSAIPGSVAAGNRFDSSFYLLVLEDK